MEQFGGKQQPFKTRKNRINTVVSSIYAAFEYGASVLTGHKEKCSKIKGFSAEGTLAKGW